MTSTAETATRQSQSAQPEQLHPRRALWNDGPIIQMQNAGKSFGKDKVVVHNLDFEVTPGQIFCLLGPSGSGKSTTMRMLTGIYKPSEGQVRVFGQEPHRFHKRWRERMGYMPQQFVLFPEISTLGNVNFVASVYGMSWFRRRPKIKRALEFVDLWDARNKLASELSGGMQRRLELAATLVHNPELIFVDEPTAGIDPVLRSKFWDHFRELRDQGRTIFVTTQYVTEADYCDTVAILNRGRILAIGEPEQIRRDAFGGDVVNLSLEFVSPESIEILRHVPGVTYIQFLNTQDLKLTVDEGAETVPLIIAALQDAGIGVKTIEQYRPDFEEVFVRLMEQDRPENDEELDSVYRESPAAPDGAATASDGAATASVGSAPAPVAAQPESRPQPPPRSEEFIRPQVAVQPEMPLSRREIRPATPQPKNLPFRREQPAPPHPLPGPTPANPNPAARRPVITSYTYQPKIPPGQPGPDPLQDTQKLPPVPPSRSAGDQKPDNRGTSNQNV